MSLVLIFAVVCSTLLDSSFTYACDDAEKYFVKPLRFDAIFKLRRVMVRTQLIWFGSGYSFAFAIKPTVMWLEDWEGEARGATAADALQYPWRYSTRGYCSRLGLRGWERAGRGAFAHGRARGKGFLLNSCLIRSIHLISLYREVYLTPNQGLLDP